LWVALATVGLIVAVAVLVILRKRKLPG